MTIGRDTQISLRRYLLLRKRVELPILAATAEIAGRACQKAFIASAVERSYWDIPDVEIEWTVRTKFIHIIIIGVQGRDDAGICAH